jgi:hypothetical protein
MTLIHLADGEDVAAAGAGQHEVVEHGYGEGEISLAVRATCTNFGVFCLKRRNIL